MRRLRIAPPVQLELVHDAVPTRDEVWAGLPEATQGQVLALLARLIARGVVDAGADHEEETRERVEQDHPRSS